MNADGLQESRTARSSSIERDEETRPATLTMRDSGTLSVV
uniref:Uncharacterized protein n=1 Tax=viral metagenome TaxID=1070528 RepID=A0A6C0EE22_9ZZZZ